MRLIDADKIEKVSADPYEQAQFDAEIEDQPTINAIPIEWIEQYIWSADTHDEKRALRKMCIQWEKENEKSSNRD